MLVTAIQAILAEHTLDRVRNISTTGRRFPINSAPGKRDRYDCEFDYDLEIVKLIYVPDDLVYGPDRVLSLEYLSMDQIEMINVFHESVI